MPDAAPRESSRNDAAEASARAFLQAFYAASRLGALWGFESKLAEEALGALENAIRGASASHGEVTLRLINDLAYLNDQRIRVDFSGYSAYRHVRDRAARRGVGEIQLAVPPARRDLIALFSMLESKPSGRVTDETEVLDEARDELHRAGVTSVSIGPPPAEEGSRGKLGPCDVREAAIQAYFRLVFVAKQTQAAARAGKAPNPRRCKRAVHEVIDVLERGEHLILAMTQVKNYHGFDACHAANVTVLACALGLRAGMHKLRVADAGVAALVHELTPHDPSRPGEAALAARDAHTARIVLAHFGFSDGALRAVLAVRDLHHAARTASGAEAPLVQRILRTCCFFDTETTPGGPDHPAHSPRETLAAMARDDGTRFDPVLVRMLRGLLGIYPFGTVLTLDTGERAIVYGRNPHFDQPARPVARVFQTADGQRVEDGEVVDLSRFDREAGRFVRSIEDTRAPCEVFARPADFVRVL